MTTTNREHDHTWRAYGQPDGTIVCDECNIAEDVNNLLITQKQQIHQALLSGLPEKQPVKGNPPYMTPNGERSEMEQIITAAQNKIIDQVTQLINKVFNKEEVNE